jgi:uncharacterized protein (DUF58 family)
MPPEKAQINEFLRPETVSRLANMDLLARLIVEGFIAGLHRSPYHGFSVEFAEYRQYNDGESTRNIDWKIFAKTDRYYTRIFEDETNLKATLLLDRSASMGFESAGVTKLRYGTLLCAALAYLMIKQRDAVGLAVFDERINTMIPHRSVRRQLFHLMKTLGETQPGAKTEISGTLHEMAERIKRKGLIVLVSDLFDEPARIINGLKHFRHRGHEMIVFHLLDPMELSLDYKGEVRFVDLETGEKLRSRPWLVKKEYRREVGLWAAELERSSKENGIDYNLITTDTPFDKALFSYLSKRQRMR